MTQRADDWQSLAATFWKEDGTELN